MKPSNQHFLRLPRRTLDLSGRPLVMGIVNLNHDSFAGDGTLDVDTAMHQARRMVANGADMIDVGGESARTNREPISEQAEIDRVAPFLQKFRAEFGAPADGAEISLSAPEDAQLSPPVLSINTWRPAVADAGLAAGAEILNDMSALPTDENARIAARHRAGLLIMHSVGEPKIPHTHVRHDDIMQTLEDFFAAKIEVAVVAGRPREAIVLDPGIDFAKQRDDNLRIYRELRRLTRFGRPILLPVSRKTVIGEVLELSEPADRDAGTVACLVAGILHGASIFRVHNVLAAGQAIRIARRILP
jgi:dihydropteroate synthase